MYFIYTFYKQVYLKYTLDVLFYFKVYLKYT